MEFFDEVGKWITEKHVLLIGGVLVALGLAISFFLKTSWGQWKRGDEDRIYGKPGANIKKKKQLHEQE